MVKLLITGDYCIHGRMQDLSADEIVASMSSILLYTQESDYALVNLECSVFDGNYPPITKCGANLYNSSESIRALKELGFKGVTLANNHFADFGSDAVKESLSLLNHYGMDYYGGGQNIEEASQIKYITINGQKIAIINCCEHEYTIATETQGGANPLDLVDIHKAIIDANKTSDYVIIIIHGGAEHYNLPTPRMQKWYRFFVESGADIVVNHHQHCYSGYEFYKGKPIIYGLGNFCFDWEGKRKSNWNEGYMVQFILDEEIKFKLIPYTQCDTHTGIFIMNERSEFDKKVRSLNDIISNPDYIQEQYKQYIINKTNEYLYIFEPIQNKLLRRLNKKGLLPTTIAHDFLPQPLYQDKEKLLTLLSYFQCESHHDFMIDILKKIKNEL